MKRGTPEHPKVYHLANLLNIPHYAAVGILELLWHFTARYAPQGDIGKHPDSVIAKAVYWERPSGVRGVKPECRFSGALVEAKWLDTCPVHRLIVHDWSDHADEAVRKFLSRHSLDFVQTAARLPLPLPLPSPAPETAPDGSVERASVEANGNPTLQEVLYAADKIGLAAWKAEDWWNEMETCGWLDHNKRPVRKWQPALTRVKVKWESDGRPDGPPKSRGYESEKPKFRL